MSKRATRNLDATMTLSDGVFSVELYEPCSGDHVCYEADVCNGVEVMDLLDQIKYEFEGWLDMLKEDSICELLDGIDTDKDVFWTDEFGAYEMFFNPDSTAGGTIEYESYEFKNILDADEYAAGNVGVFFDVIMDKRYEENVDVTNPCFESYAKEFMARDGSLGCTKETMDMLVSAAKEALNETRDYSEHH